MICYNDKHWGWLTRVQGVTEGASAETLAIKQELGPT